MGTRAYTYHQFLSLQTQASLIRSTLGVDPRVEGLDMLEGREKHLPPPLQ